MNVGVLGLTLKPGTYDLIKELSISNVIRLLDESTEIVVYDLVGIENFKHTYPTEITYVDLVESDIKIQILHLYSLNGMKL